MQLDEELWLARFDQHMEVRGWSEHTRHSYGAALRLFFRYLAEHQVESLAGVTRDQLEDYRTRLFYRKKKQGRYLALGTSRVRLMALKAFYRFLAKRGFVLVDLAAGIELPRQREGLPTVLSEAEVERLLQVPDTSTLLGIRDRALLEVLYGTGIRNGELRALELEACDLAVPSLRILWGKGGKSRVVPLGEEALAWLEAYLGQVRPRLLARPEEQHVFLSKFGRPLQNEPLIRLVNGLGQRAGLAKKVTPHVLRHSMATHMLRRGAGLRQLQVLLGHSSSSTTETYTRVELADLRRVVERCHPRERGHRA